ncbi:peptidase S8 [Pseudidiomarina salinarum]|uniref:Peptidase S8 n=1 Tax=Pseudidiomarina salinarum TaxID=435908 RepID=A0A094ISL3_9GAMM|nr:S8 family serine peptidase [Pseudidiomarina salinarum]KFZ30137.1 peptidase S8 [Pseudidiomarina salinarum]RUO68259.1 peptidase S8 [Pseudidiomarina salinarum]
MKPKITHKLTSVSLAIALSLPAASLWAKTFDPNLQDLIAASDSETLHQVIITFDQTGSPSTSQLNFLSSLGIHGVSLNQLPMVGALATPSQIEAIYARDDVVSVWNNETLSYENNGATELTGVQQLRADQNLRKNGIPYSGRGIGVVVNDSGVDGTHSDLMYPQHVVQNVLAQTNLRSFSDLLPITYQENVANTDIGGGHGTHVAGTIGGNGAMSSGLHAGVAPGADIIGYGSGAGLFILDTLGGFDYALTHQFDYNIRVISNSFGSTADTGSDFNPDHPTNVATKALADRGIITVFSAGNSGSGESTITGNFKKAPWVVTVAAGDKDGNLADFSSRGVDGKSGTATVDGVEYVWEDRPTVTAPGVDIISARASTSSLGGLSASQDSELIAPEHLAFYTTSSGTSMSAPHISGIVALMLEANPDLTWQQVKQILQDTATVMPGREAWEVGAGYVNAHAAVKAAVEMDDRFGDTVKLNRDFNASAQVTEGASFSRTVNYTVAGESDFETFEVNEATSLVMASANIETGTAFVLEDPAGNTYGSGIGLPVLGSSVGTSAPGMAGTWKVYARGIGSVSGLSVDPLGLTNGIGLPGAVDVNIRLLETNGYDGISDTANHPGRGFIEYAVSERLMDAESSGFNPDQTVIKQTLADVLTLSGSVRQPQTGNQLVYLDATSENAAMLNAVSEQGASLKDRAYDFASVLPAHSADIFGSDDLVARQQLAYSLVQSLGLEPVARDFDPEQDVQVVVFDQVVTLSDSDDIAPELRGYVQAALHMGLMDARIEVVQGPFDLEPKLTATFAPAEDFTRAELAKAVTRLHPLMSK